MIKGTPVRNIIIRTQNLNFVKKASTILVKSCTNNKTIDQSFFVDKNDIIHWHERLSYCNFSTIIFFLNQMVEPAIKLTG